MCNLYSLTKGQATIVALVRAMRDHTGNLPPMPGIFPDYLAPIARNATDGVRELAMARWGMPGPPAFGGAPITNIRNVKSPHWRAWLPAGYEQQIKGDTTMFTLTKIAIAATFIFGAVSASLAYDENAKWYPETPQDFKQTHRATDTFRGDAYDSVKSDQKRGSSQKILERNNH